MEFNFKSVGARFHPRPQNKIQNVFHGSGWNPTPTMFIIYLITQITI